MANELIIKTDFDRQRLIKYIKGLDISRPVVFSWKVWRQKRSLDANALFHLWVGEIVVAAAGRGEVTTKEEAKKDLKKMFLGYEKVEHADPKTGEMITKTRLRRTRDLDSGEMFFFMEQVQEWAYRLLSLALTSKSDKDEFAGWQREANQ